LQIAFHLFCCMSKSSVQDKNLPTIFIRAFKIMNNHHQWHPEAYKALLQKDYAQVISIYEAVINNDLENPNAYTNYFYLGLAQLLQGLETEAQLTWMNCISEEISSEQIEKWTSELVDILHTEAKRQYEIAEYDMAWVLCQHICEIDSENLDNLLLNSLISLQRNTLEEEDLSFSDLISSLQSPVTSFNLDLLWQLWEGLMKYPPYPYLIEFTEVCIPYAEDLTIFVYRLIYTAVELSYFSHRSDLAIRLLEICQGILPEEVEVLNHLSAIYQNDSKYDLGIESAQKSYELSTMLIDKFFANAVLLRAHLNKGNNWQNALAIFVRQQSLLSSLITEQPKDLPQAIINRLYTANFFAPYFQDTPRLNRHLQNQIAQLCQTNLNLSLNLDLAAKMQDFRKRLDNSTNNSQTRKLKIGYIGHSMASHSVGWLARWLIRHHDREKFELYGYFQTYRKVNDDLQSWYEQQMDGVYRAGVDGDGKCDDFAERIYQDRIDILVDIDSITLDLTCGVMARKPAPIQITWLGWDASGIPAIDYFIADPYVLPNDAEEYYQEKIWRLPQTYIAVDGFEIAVPNLRRDQLDIPADAVVYLSAQRGYKRHIDTVRLQLQILKAVPNSYFLIKGIADQEAIQEYFNQLAEEEGVDTNCLRFLPPTPSEAIHRANLGVADIVLDTYPYNGATTTLETLWMGIPLVTKVGEQFAARNSYTMMMNVGVTEGLAWTDSEYVEWGIRLGTDAQLRQDIATRLKASRQTSPLWNAKQFTLEMEKAYQAMWQRFVQSL
jgi:predicted O-linked N-acetylglucosamine transferase (SPINDLY family)